MLLKIQGVVRLSSDIELRYTASGKAVASFSVASSDKYKTADGEKKEETCFINCTVWGKLGEICNQYLRKGSQVYIEGRLKLDSWTDQNGGKRSKHGVVVENMTMLGNKDDAQSNSQPQQEQNYQAPTQNHQQQQKQTQQDIPEIDVNSDEIPF